jgi:hypothetical protein
MLGWMTDGQIWRQLMVDELLAGGDFSSWRLPQHPNTDDPAVIADFRRRYKARRKEIVAAARERYRIAAEQRAFRHNVALIAHEHGIPIPMLEDAVPWDTPRTVSKAELERYFRSRVSRPPHAAGLLDDPTPCTDCGLSGCCGNEGCAGASGCTGWGFADPPLLRPLIQ